MSDFSRWSTSSIICAPFLDSDFTPDERTKMIAELRRRGYPRAVVVVLRVLAGFGLWWNLFAWEWGDLNLIDVLAGYSLNFLIATVVLAALCLIFLAVGRPLGNLPALVLASAAACAVLFWVAFRKAKRERHAA
jgi:hypothetical protein